MAKGIEKKSENNKRPARRPRPGPVAASRKGQGLTNKSLTAAQADGLAHFQLMQEFQARDPMLKIIRQVSEKGWPRAKRGRRPTIEGLGPATSGSASRRPKGRWPLDLVKECSGNGILALRVWPRAGLECYGLSDGDIIFIGLDDPAEGGPAFAAINDNVVIGAYKSAPGDRITIVPFVQGTEPVKARKSHVQVVFSLKALARWNVTHP